MECEVEFTDEFEAWWDSLDADEQDSVNDGVNMLEDLGPELEYPWSSKIYGSRHSHMRELRVQHRGDPYRVLYAFNPLRNAILLIGGNKTGDGRFYRRMVPIADALYDEHLRELERERNHG